MTALHRLWIDGIALWTPQAPGWAAAAPALRGDTQAGPPTAARPSPTLLAPNERRRAPDSVLLALEVASAALAGSGHDPVTTASVFTSAHGDLPMTDALCRTLAANPLRLSPTRFHHSVHNAASGYWAIASGSTAPSTALSAGGASFAAGWLEAASLCAGDGLPVLLVGFDTEAVGALASVNRSRGLLGVALVLAPQRSAASLWQVDWQLAAEAPAPPALRSWLAQGLAGNAQADALPLFEALARGDACTLALPLAPAVSLCLRLQPSASNTPAGA
jgi:hypothetical protein